MIRLNPFRFNFPDLFQAQKEALDLEQIFKGNSEDFDVQDKKKCKSKKGKRRKKR